MYNAGFPVHGFLYNDAGTLTLVYSGFDPVFDELFPERVHLCSNPQLMQEFEDMLQPAPVGGRWRFSNPARCVFCAEPISESCLHTIVYIVYPGSIITYEPTCHLRDYLIRAT